MGRKILTALSAPFDLNGQEAHITGSMGAAIYPENGSDPAALVRSADQAMLASTGIDPTLLDDDAAITWAIISLAHSLKLKVVAEGVETTEQLDMLRDERRLHWETPLNAPSKGH